MASRTFETVGAREDLIDVITNIAPDESPLYSKFAKTTATGMTHSWLTDGLGTPGANKHLEDADFVLAQATPRVKLNNDVQIFMKGYWVTESQQAILKAGVKDELAYQMGKALREIARDVEYAYLMNDARAVSASSAAGQLGGIPFFNVANVVDNSGTPRALTETLLNDALQKAWEKGGTPDTLVVSGKNKRIISGFTAGAQKTMDMGTKKLTQIIDIYESDFGTLKVMAHRMMPNTAVYALQTEMWKTAYLKPFETKPIPQTSLKLGKVIVGQLTLECRSKDANVAIVDLQA